MNGLGTTRADGVCQASNLKHTVYSHLFSVRLVRSTERACSANPIRSSKDHKNCILRFKQALLKELSMVHNITWTQRPVEFCRGMNQM